LRDIKPVAADSTAVQVPAQLAPNDLGSIGLALDMCDADWLRNVSAACDVNRIADRGHTLADSIEESVRESLVLRDLVHHTRAERDALAAKVAKLEADIACMVEKAASKSLDGYRELGRQTAAALNERDNAHLSLATMTAHRDALASALRALHASADFAYSRFASRRPAMSIGDMDAMESALKNTLAALREHADTEVR